MAKQARWYVGTIDDGRGGTRAIHCRTRRHARARIAEQSTADGYRVSAKSVDLVERLPGPADVVIAASSQRHRELDASSGHMGMTKRTPVTPGSKYAVGDRVRFSVGNLGASDPNDLGHCVEIRAQDGDTGMVAFRHPNKKLTGWYYVTLDDSDGLVVGVTDSFVRPL